MRKRKLILIFLQNLIRPLWENVIKLIWKKYMSNSKQVFMYANLFELMQKLVSMKLRNAVVLKFDFILLDINYEIGIKFIYLIVFIAKLLNRSPLRG